MNPLSNAVHREDGTCLPDIGMRPNAIPEAAGSKTGESVRYAHKPGEAWYVLRITYARERKAYDHITSRGVEAYLPMHTHEEKTSSIPIRTRYVTKPLVPGIVFVHAAKKTVESFIKGTDHIECITAYYDHFRKDARGYNDYLVVPDDQMDNFMRLADITDKHIRLVIPGQCHYKSGDTVIIREGKFKGITGKVARIGGQQRVVVTLNGVCSIATAYIPSAFLEVYDNTE